ncbi:class I SAM-dependent methyltransferase [soil metagenome]
MKSTIAQIRERFDKDVERFSNLETGQSATIDAPLALELITDAAAAICPSATDLLDIGCGAGNYTLKTLSKIPNLNCTLVDLSAPMLVRAKERVSGATRGTIITHQSDIRELELSNAKYDIVVAAAVLHHLRGDEDWELVFAKIFRALKPGGSFWISDLIIHDNKAVHAAMWKRYGQYLSSLKDEAYRDHVFNYIDYEDTPRSLNYQIELLRKVGFAEVEILHKNSVFAAFGGIKS